MPHSDNEIRLEYLRNYNKTTAGRIRTKKYLNTQRGMLALRLKTLRRRFIRQGQEVPEECYISHPIHQYTCHPNEDTTTRASQNFVV